MRLHNSCQTIYAALLLTFYRSNWIWKVNGRLQFRNYPTHHCTKMSQRTVIKNWKSSVFYYLEPGLYPSITDIVEAMNTLIQERHNHIESCITVRVSRRTPKIEIYLANEESGLAFFSTELGHIFGSNIRNEFGVMLRKQDLTNQNLLTTLSAYALSCYTRAWLSTISLATRRPHCCVAFFSFQSWRHYNYRTVHELSDI